MRRLDESIEEYNDYVMFYKGEIEGQRGVGFMVKVYLNNYIEDFIGVTDRIAILNIKRPCNRTSRKTRSQIIP